MTSAQAPDRGALLPRFPLVAFLFVLIFIILTSGARDLLFRDPDLFWHIVVGRRTLETGTVPRVDEWSHTFRGHVWIAKEWLAQVALAAAFDAGGWKGLTAVMGCAIALTYTLLFLALNQRMRVVPSLVVALFAFALSTPHFLTRPHILSFPLLVVWTAGIVRAADTHTRPSFFLLPVMTLWANLHGGFTLGLLLGGGLAVEAIFASDPRARLKVAIAWGIFLGAAGLAALITPYGYRAAMMTYELLAGSGNESLKYISEWQPFNFAREKLAGPLLLIALFGSFAYGVKLPFMRCVLVVGMIYLTLLYVRFVALSAIIIPLLILTPLLDQFSYLEQPSAEELDPALGHVIDVMRKPLLSAAIVVVMIVGVFTSMYFPERQPLRVITPRAAVDYMVDHHKNDKVYNDYIFGGYLIFRGIPTFVDGRSDQLFGGGFLDELYASLQAPRAEFLQILDKYDVSVALVQPKSAETLRLDEAPEWRRAYSDDIAILYERSRNAGHSAN